MADQEEEDLRMALRMSMQHSPPEPKRSKPRENVAVTSVDSSEESPEIKARRLQRELMAAAAERRMMMGKNTGSISTLERPVGLNVSDNAVPVVIEDKRVSTGPGSEKVETLGYGRLLSHDEANQLFSMIFGGGVSRDILAQWTNQGIRFSPDPETSMGLVQHEGGPCGVLAAIQAFVLKILLFSPDKFGWQDPGSTRSSKSEWDVFSCLTEDGKTRALVRSIGEILSLCGSNRRVVIATLNVLGHENKSSKDGPGGEIDSKGLETLSIESALDLQRIIRVNECTSPASAFKKLEAMVPEFQSRMGAMLFLISALLSRGLDSIQTDRDDPSLPLVTAPFGHASQEIVNLLLCGQAVPNVFDGRMDFGGGMFLKGIPVNVEVGFLTLLESLNFCKVGHYLKYPKYPIWVVGSESHYTVLFALDTSVQDENELEVRESQIRKAFDAQDQSGGGGFISVEGFHQVLKETNINLPPEKLDYLCNTGFIVRSEFWQVLLDLDKSLGGLKDSTGLMGKKVFDIYHFNGIAKSVVNGTQLGEIPVQRPRLTKLRVSVPPRWTPEEFIADMAATSVSTEKDAVVEVSKPEPCQHAPLVDCIRTRWPRALCNWVGDPPSIV